MSDTPDFDSMTPEQIMAWMESLAKRQGADERGFVTSADMDVPEIDESSVDVSSLGEYIPHGWTKERWEEQKKKEEAERAARKAASSASTPKPATPPPQPIATPPPMPVKETPPASGPAVAAASTPDFDNMTPEQIMAWMESLAKRQGADERGFVTSADMDVPEIDESSVDVSSLGEYIPHGWTKERWEEQKKKEEAERAARKAASSASTPKPATPPPQSIATPPPISELPTFDAVEEDESTVIASTDSLSWLEELASGGQGDMPDLSALDAINEPIPTIPDLPIGGASDDPLAWLESLAGGHDEPSAPDLSAATLAEVPSPIDSGDDPLAWLETLAKRQDADEEELTTAANLDIPLPNSVSDDGPGYKDYSFESPVATTPTTSFPPNLLDDEEDVEPELSLEDPEAWLDKLASGGAPSPNVEEDLDDEEEADAEVIQRMREGTLSPEDVEGWFNRAFEKAERIAEIEDDDDGEAPAVPAELPDWLMDQMQIEPPPPPPAEPDEKLIAAIESPPSGNMPDWLGDEGSAGDMSDIFDDEALAPLATEELLAESDDTWVEAFHIESQMDPEVVPDWYRERLEAEGYNVDAIAEPDPVFTEEPPAPPSPAPSAPITLEKVTLPLETQLQAGEPENLPDWLADAEAIATPRSTAAFLDTRDVVEATAVPDWLASDDGESDSGMSWLTDDLSTPAPSEALPDWLADTNVEPTEIPDWLLDTLDEGAPAVPATSSQPTVAFTPEPAPTPQPAPTVVTPVSPAPVPAAARNIDVAATLQSARNKISSGDIDGALADYEAIVRANSQLDIVSADLEKLLSDERHKKNPAPYRVLGDSLMRQGKLQAALDTYRKALNLL